jgi:hypothetical protein
VTDLSPDASSTKEPLAFGDPIYKACDHCQQAISIIPLISGNPIGGELWSDGYMEAPQLPEQQLLGRCPHCGEIVCIPELSDYSNPVTLDQNQDYAFKLLALEDYALMLEHLEHIDDEYHLYLRIKFWQMCNHPRRNAETELPLSKEEIANLESLLALLGNDDSDRLLKADILRQLGEFERARRVLSDPFQQQVKDIVLRIKELVNAELSQPAIIFSPSSGKKCGG